MDDRKKGAIILIVSTVFFALVNIFVKLAEGIPLMEIIMYRNLINTIFALYLLKQESAKLSFPDKKSGIAMFSRCVCGLISLLCNMYAATNAPQTVVSTITRLAPYMTIVLGALILKEKVYPYHYVAMIVAIVGVIIVTGKIGVDAQFIPLLAAFICAVLSAFIKLFLRMLKGKLAPSATVFYYASFSFITAIPFTIANYVAPSGIQWFYLFMIGISATIAQITLSRGLQMVPAGEGSMYDLAGIPASAILALFILGEAIKMRIIIGGGLIIIAAYILFSGNKTSEKEG